MWTPTAKRLRTTYNRNPKPTHTLAVYSSGLEQTYMQFVCAREWEFAPRGTRVRNTLPSIVALAHAEAVLATKAVCNYIAEELHCDLGHALPTKSSKPTRNPSHQRSQDRR